MDKFPKMRHTPKQTFPRQGTLPWTIATGTWKGMTIPEMAEDIGVREESIKYALSALKKRYNIEVDYDRRSKREMEQIPQDLSQLPPYGTLWRLIHEDWSGCTLEETAKLLHKNRQGFVDALRELERVHGIKVEFKPQEPPQKMKCYLEQLKRSKRCRKCVYWYNTIGCCNYLAMMGKKRPCPAGAQCTAFKPLRHKRSQPSGIAIE